jgi:hypothetical protein
LSKKKKEFEQKKEFRELRKGMRAVGWVEGSVFKKTKSDKKN